MCLELCAAQEAVLKSDFITRIGRITLIKKAHAIYIGPTFLFFYFKFLISFYTSSAPSTSTVVLLFSTSTKPL